MASAADLGVHSLGVTFDFISPYILFSHRTRNPSPPKSKRNATHQRQKERTAGVARRRAPSKRTRTRDRPRRCLERRAPSRKRTTSRRAKIILGRCCGKEKTKKSGPSNTEGKQKPRAARSLWRTRVHVSSDFPAREKKPVLPKGHARRLSLVKMINR